MQICILFDCLNMFNPAKDDITIVQGLTTKFYCLLTHYGTPFITVVLGVGTVLISTTYSTYKINLR